MLGMGKKKARGTELIEEVAGRFTSMVEELDSGVADCVDERTIIEGEIEMLRQRDLDLDSSIKRAAAIATNLRTLLGA